VHVTAALAVGLMVFAVLVLLAGLTPFIGIPVAVMVFLAPIAWFAVAGRRVAEKRRTVDKSGVPSSRAASYEPVVDPTERGP
jgi:membrane protein implicated in regulation of membrane protease activity